MAAAPAGDDFEAATAPSQAPSWNEDTLHLWNVPLDLSDDIHELFVACLTTDERARGERFRFARDRRRFAASRGALRLLIMSLKSGETLSPTKSSLLMLWFTFAVSPDSLFALET